MKKHTIPSLFFTAALACSSIFAQETKPYTSPDAVKSLLKKSTTTPTQKESALLLLGDTIFLGMHANKSEMQRNSSSGVARLYGIFSPKKLGYDTTGQLEFKVEYRDSFTTLSPIDFGLSLGYVGLVQSTYSNQGLRVTNCYWNQELFHKQSNLFVGFLDTTNYVDVYLMASPWDGFGNLVFATGSATIAGLPDGAFGVMFSSWIDKQFYVVAGIADANADPTNPAQSFTDMWNTFETFKSLEFGYTPAKERLYLDNAHITFWQIDARNEAGTPSGYGVSFSLVSTTYMKWFSFLRGGWSKDGGSLLTNSLSIGVGYHPKPNGDIFGIGLNRSQPNETTFPDASKTQYTTEVFYNYKPFQHVEITPSIQYLRDPAYNTQTRNVILGSLRLRAFF